MTSIQVANKQAIEAARANRAREQETERANREKENLQLLAEMRESEALSHKKRMDQAQFEEQQALNAVNYDLAVANRHKAEEAIKASQFGRGQFEHAWEAIPYTLSQITGGLGNLIKAIF